MNTKQLRNEIRALIIGLIIFALLLIAVAFSTFASNKKVTTELYARNQIVQISNDDGYCSGVRLRYVNKTYILTAGHCRKYIMNGLVKVTNSDASLHIVRAIAEDPLNDLLLLESILQDSGVELGNSQKIGDFVYKLGKGGYRPTFKTEGRIKKIEIISVPQFRIETMEDVVRCAVAPKFAIEQAPGYGMWCIVKSLGVLSDAQVIPGDSGGGLFNSKGELVGIVSAYYDEYGAFVPLSEIKRFLKSAVGK